MLLTRPSLLRPLAVLAACAVSACGGGRGAGSSGELESFMRPLAQLAGQRVILTPAFSVATVDPLGWNTKIPPSREYLKTLDDELSAVLSARGLRTQWVYPADLVRAARTNPTYASDPYSLGVNMLRNPALKSGDRLGEPLATQLRTMIALQNDARAVLVPVELRFEKVATSAQGVAVLRVALLDGRLGDVRWIGTVKSDPADTPSRAVLTSLAAHFADLITAP